MTQRLGIEIPADLPIGDKLTLARWADQHGFADLWHAEISDPDALVTLAAVAACTQRIRLGTAIVPLGTRSIPVIAAATATLCDLAPGRFALGVGVSSKVIVEQWNGMRRGRPLGRARESIDLLRLLLGGGRSEHDGEFVSSHGFRLRRPPVDPPLLLLGALNERMLELAGEVADGVLLNFVPVRAVPRALDAVARGAERAGRAAPPDTAIMLPCTVNGDRAAAREPFARALAFYLSAPPYQQALTWYGLGDDVVRAKEAWAAKDIERVRRGLSAEFVDALGAFGPLEHCVARVEDYWRAGVNSVAVSPIEADFMGTLEVFAPLAQRLAGNARRHEPLLASSSAGHSE
jgi:probable F420-dependent oxidoreductase